MKNKKVIQYFIITFVWAWVLWTPFVLPYFNVYDMTETLEGLLMLAVMLGAFGPLVAALIVISRDGGKQALKHFFKKCFNLRVNWKYYVIAIVLSFGVTMVAHYITNGFGIDELPNNLFPEDLGVPVFVLVIPYTLMIMFLGGGQEEFGWRGFAQDILQDQYGVLKASLIIGVIWGVWHAPLWLIPGEGHSYYSFIAFVLYATSWSVTIGVLYTMSGKKMIIPWIMHTVGNVSVPFFPVLFLEDVPQPGYWVWVICNIVLAILIYIIYRNYYSRSQSA